MLTKAFIPYGGYYSTPFARWQGTLANENSITLGAETSTRWLAQKNWDPKIFDYLILGITMPAQAILRRSLGLSPNRCNRYTRRRRQSGLLHGNHLYLSGRRGG